MAIAVTKTVFLSVGVDLSAYVLDARLEAGAESIDVTALGTDTGRIFMAGLKTFTLNVEFQQDYAASKVDATLAPLLGAAAFAVVLRPSSGAKSATNPEWTGNWILESYNPVSNRVGELQTASAVFRPAGAISRATT